MNARDARYGPPLVPVDTYPKICIYQRLPPDWEDSARQVVMRGALHCRIASRRTARHYATAVLERYIRRLHLSETNPARWQRWVNEELLEVARRRSWWSLRWERTCARDLNWLVCEYSVLIDGVRHDVYDAERMENVRLLLFTARRMMGDLPRLSLCSRPKRRLAIKTRQN